MLYQTHSVSPGWPLQLCVALSDQDSETLNPALTKLLAMVLGVTEKPTLMLKVSD